MTTLSNDWPIKHRADLCAVTHRAFDPGEQFYTLLFREGDGFRREDLSMDAWTSRNENIRPFSFWKSRYEPTTAAPPEPIGKESAEELLRRLLAQNNPAHANACYVLAAMLERKRVLKQVKSEQPDQDASFPLADSGDASWKVTPPPALIYEHVKTGDVFIIPEVQLHLGELDSVQAEVATLLKTNQASPI